MTTSAKAIVEGATDALPVNKPDQSLLREGWVHVGSIADVERAGSMVVKGTDRPIVVIAHLGKVYALDNRCPHLGFPLHKGTIRDGILTCHWHEARFDICSGCTLDLWADDTPAFDTRIAERQVYVCDMPRGQQDYAWRQLEKGMEQGLALLQAKGLIALLQAKTDPIEIIRAIIKFGLKYKNNPAGITELAIAANLRDILDSETLYFLLLRSSSVIAGSAMNSRRTLRQPLDGKDYSFDGLKKWFYQWALTRDPEACERVLRTFVGMGATPGQLTDLLVGAANQRIFADQGHTVDLINKMLELLEQVGNDQAAGLLALCVAGIANSRGAEENYRWRQPIDIVTPLREAEAELPKLLEESAKKRAASPIKAAWTAGKGYVATLLAEDPLAIIRETSAALAAGTAPAELSALVCYAAALRLVRFATANEIGDWFNPQHTYTYANAVDRSIRRSPTTDVVKALYHAALSVYQDRFLNVPPANVIDRAADRADQLPDKEVDLRKHILELLDGKSGALAPAEAVNRFLSLGFSTNSLANTLAFATIREDLDFHTLQVLEAGTRQAENWPGKPEATHIFMGVIRDLAAFCPTPRAQLRTARTALKLHRGELMYEEEK
ncbi:MAG TPA: Rieske (2Fe-2S) protein [Tepidisphaeraceae bacterium]|jgi:nitrite reductase/ring-hydroxylating ferredoxin subunit|nr:Rieske (2Fe-2S) protein [Tepidisphaeraceae bacterium]